MARKLICRWCGEKSPRPEMQKVVTGNKTKVNKYYHKEECYEEFLMEEEFKKVEQEKRDSLYKEVMDIYNTKALPNSFYIQIEGLRHGNRVFKTQSMGKRYREGYDYDLIEETYEESRDAIEWSLQNKAFVNLGNALNYGLSIIINNIYGVEKRRERVQSREHMEEIAENVKLENQGEVVFDEFETTYKPKEKDDDFFDIFD